MWAFIVKRVNESSLEDEQNITASAIPTVQQVGFAFGAAFTGLIANYFGLGNDLSVVIAKSTAPWIFVFFVPFTFVVIVAGMRLSR